MKKMTKLFLMIGLFVCLACTLSVFAFAEGEMVSNLETPYGTIKSDYADIDQFPFVVFDSNKNNVGGYSLLTKDGGSALDSLTWKSGTYYIYMRKDSTSTTTWNNHALGSNKNIVIDLGGNTLSYSARMFYSKTQNSRTHEVTFKNGTLLPINNSSDKKSYIFTLVTHNSNSNAKLDLLFEDITFDFNDGGSLYF